MNFKEAIDQLMREHDGDSQGAAQRLREIAAARPPAEELPRLTWLINHVVGEKHGSWSEAQDLHRLAAKDASGKAVSRNRAIAAALSGDVLEQWACESQLERSTGATSVQAATSVRIGCLQHLSQSAPPDALFGALASLQRQFPSVSEFGPLGDQYASGLNNALSAMLKRNDIDFDVTDRARTFIDSAILCRRVWSAVGTWVNQERADYLVALCANRCSHWSEAKAAALSGVALTEEHAAEEVDRAFLLLALSHALRGEGDTRGGAEAKSRAFDIASGFEAESLRSWFEEEAGEPLPARTRSA